MVLIIRLECGIFAKTTPKFNENKICNLYDDMCFGHGIMRYKHY